VTPAPPPPPPSAPKKAEVAVVPSSSIYAQREQDDIMSESSQADSNPSLYDQRHVKSPVGLKCILLRRLVEDDRLRVDICPKMGTGEPDIGINSTKSSM
jgi:hypothetical protein